MYSLGGLVANCHVCLQTVLDLSQSFSGSHPPSKTSQPLAALSPSKGTITDPTAAPIKIAAEINLSREEDSVTSLAVGPRRGPSGRSLVVYAGINEAPSDKNQHFRVLSVDPQKQSNKATVVATGSGDSSAALPFKVTETSRSQLFNTRTRDAYQRLTRLSFPQLTPESGSTSGVAQAAGGSGAQLGAVATGLAPDAQIAIFDVPATTGAGAGSGSGAGAAGSGGPKIRGRPLNLAKEANDLDLIQTGESGGYSVAYCTDYDLYLASLPAQPAGAPATGGGGASTRSSAAAASLLEQQPATVFDLVYETPENEGTGSGPAGRPKFRSIRFLTPLFLLAVVNIPKVEGGGVALQAFRLPSATSPQKSARVAVSQRLPRAVQQATALAVRNLSPPIASATGRPVPLVSQSQFLVAVGTADATVALYSVDRSTSIGGSIELLSDFGKLKILKKVHSGVITGLAFSVFVPPQRSTNRVFSIRLASISAVGQTVVVHSIPLKKVLDPGSAAKASTIATTTPNKKNSAAAQAAAVAAAAAVRSPRYVSAIKSKRDAPISAIVSFAVFMALVAIFVQGWLEVKGLSRPVIGAKQLVPITWQVPIRVGPVVPPAGSLLAEFAADPSNEREGRKLFLKGDEGVQVDLHNEDVHGPAKSWEQLGKREKELWKRRLQDAGHWAEGMGDNLFKGVLFGEIGGAVGRMVGG